MAKKLVDCDHCGGKRNCTQSGGRSCRACLEAAGMGRRGWATVRCSFCGGRGKVLVDEEELAAAEKAEGPTEEEGATEAEEDASDGEA